MIISVSDELLKAITVVELSEKYRSENLCITFSWAYGSEGTSADGIAYDNGTPFRQYDVAVPNNGEVWILERNIYNDFEIEWTQHPLSNFGKIK
jgi:hypothetical protein